MVRTWKTLALLTAAGIGLGLGARPLGAVEGDANDEADLRKIVKSLQDHVARQDRRIAELEGRVSADPNGPAVTAEDVRRIVKEMNEDAAKRSGDFKATWENGVWFRSGDGRFAFHPGGRLQADWGWARAPGIESDNPNFGQGAGKPLRLRDGEEFRTIRLWGEGTMFRYIQYKLELDFAADKVVLKDAFLRMTDVPAVGNVTVGQFKEPFSLEQLSSDTSLTFLERSLADTLVPARNPGFMVSGAFLGPKKAERMTYAVGLFRQEGIGDTGVEDGTAVNSDRGYAGTARLTGLPYFENGGEKLIHLGIAYSIRGTNDDTSLRYRARPEAHFLPYRFVDTGALSHVEHVQLLGAEAAAVFGPASIQGEYVASLLDFDTRTASATSSTDNSTFRAFYVQGSYFVTPGDRRNYNTACGAFNTMRPKKNFREDGGWGAVELATRFSYLDVDDDGLGAARGELRDWTMGVNWYLNPNVRVSANYILALPHRVDTDRPACIYLMRFQLDF